MSASGYEFNRWMQHGRSAVTTAYYGSYGHALRGTKPSVNGTDAVATTDPDK